MPNLTVLKCMLFIKGWRKITLLKSLKRHNSKSQPYIKNVLKNDGSM